MRPAESMVVFMAESYHVECHVERVIGFDSDHGMPTSRAAGHAAGTRHSTLVATDRRGTGPGGATACTTADEDAGPSNWPGWARWSAALITSLERPLVEYTTRE